jgi:hypothetical protein
VRDSADILARDYRIRVQMLHALNEINEMAGMERGAEVWNARRDLRDKLPGFFDWSRKTGRLS